MRFILIRLPQDSFQSDTMHNPNKIKRFSQKILMFNLLILIFEKVFKYLEKFSEEEYLNFLTKNNEINYALTSLNKSLILNS